LGAAVALMSSSYEVTAQYQSSASNQTSIPVKPNLSIKTLNPIFVRPKLNPFDYSDFRLHRLIEELPGGDIQPTESGTEKFMDWVILDLNTLPTDKQQLEHGHRQASSVTFNEISHRDDLPERDR